MTIGERIKPVVEAWAPLFQILAAISTAIVTGYSVLKFLAAHLSGSSFGGLEDPLVAGKYIVIGEAVTVFLLIGTPCWVPHINPAEKYRNAKSASHQFCVLWFLVWPPILLYYVILAYSWADYWNGHLPFAQAVGVDALNLLSSACLFLCYLVLIKKSVASDLRGWHHMIFWVMTGCIILIALESFLGAYRNAFEVLFGLLEGVGIALFIGRLESRFFNLKPWVVIVLYGYAMLQVISTDHTYTLLVYSLALVLKVLLFWEVRQAIKDGRLTYYMFAYRDLLDRASKERDDVLSDMLIR